MIATTILLENAEVSRAIRKRNARLMEVNPTYSSVLLAGMTDEVTALYHDLKKFDCLLQYSRSVRVAVTRGFSEPVSDFLKSEEESSVL